MRKDNAADVDTPVAKTWMRIAQKPREAAPIVEVGRMAIKVEGQGVNSRRLRSERRLDHQ